MESLIIVLLVCCFYTVFGASVYKLDTIPKLSRDTSHVRTTAHVVKRSSSDSTFVTAEQGRKYQRDGNPVFTGTIRQNRTLFSDIELDNIPFEKMMQNIHNNRERLWEMIKKEIVDNLPCYKSRIEINKSKSVIQFYESIIHVYTMDTCIFSYTNYDLRNNRPASSQSLGLYALMLNIVLTQWKLEKYNNITYHGVSFTADEYTVGTVFTWPAFTSSSSSVQVGCGFAKQTLFIINNTALSDWRPKSIAQYSAFPREAERLYPAAATFNVTHITIVECRNERVKAIYISLQPDQDTSNSETSTAVIHWMSMKTDSVLTAVISIVFVVIVV